MNQAEHIQIIGAGIIGVCCGLYLQKAGYQVTLIDRKGLGQECSKGNAGHFATEQIFPLADKSLLSQVPKMLLDPAGPFRIRFGYLPKAIPWFMRFILNMRKHKYQAHLQALRSLNHQAIDAFEPLLVDAGLEHMLIKKGSLLTFEHTPAQDIVKQFQAFSEHGIPLKYIDKKAISDLEPNLSDKVKSAFLFTDVGHTIDPEALCIHLGNHFVAQGGKIRVQEVSAIRFDSQGVLLKSGAQTLRSDKVVLAAGAWSKRLLTPLGYKVPLDTERGYHLMLDQQSLLQRPVASAERKFIMTPMLQGLRLAGTVEFAGLQAKMDRRRADALLPQAKALLNGLSHENPENAEAWMGMRPSLPDSLPVLGETSQHPGLYFAFGHQHLGLTQAGITGKLLSQLISGQQTEIDLTPFNINRFNSSVVTTQQTVRG